MLGFAANDSRFGVRAMKRAMRIAELPGMLQPLLNLYMSGGITVIHLAYCESVLPLIQPSAKETPKNRQVWSRKEASLGLDDEFAVPAPLSRGQYGRDVHGLREFCDSSCHFATLCHPLQRI